MVRPWPPKSCRSSRFFLLSIYFDDGGGHEAEVKGKFDEGSLHLSPTHGQGQEIASHMPVFSYEFNILKYQYLLLKWDHFSR